MPNVIRDQADRRAAAQSAQASPGVTAGRNVHHHAPNAVTIHVHPEKGHSAADIATMVHRKFNDAAPAQYNDGVYS